MSAAKGVSEGGYLWGCDENGKHLGFKTLVLQVRPLPASPLNARGLCAVAGSSQEIAMSETPFMPL